VNGAGCYTARVDWYEKGRPEYAPDLIPYLREAVGLKGGWRVADVGAGTGKMARLLCAAGCGVAGVEPDPSMRAIARSALAGMATFTVHDGCAEATALPPRSVDLITAGQSFHWFDPKLARLEFQRITRGRGPVVLAWNEQRRDGSPLHEQLDEVLRTRVPRYAAVSEYDARLHAALDTLFAGHDYSSGVLQNDQQLDEDGLIARVLSSSYSPLPDEPSWPPLERELRQIHRMNQRDGHVSLEYDLLVVHGWIHCQTEATTGEGSE
jgi:SAM-dependent methyltransferase